MTQGRAALRRWAPAVAVAVLVAVLLTSGLEGYHCGRCADQRDTIELVLIPIVDIMPHFDEYGIVHAWERAHGRPCANLWRRGSFNPTAQANPYFPPLHFAAATVRDRSKAERLMLTEAPENLNAQDALGRTPMHWIAATSGIGAMHDQLRARGVWLDIRDEDGLTPLDWDWRVRDGRSTP